MFTDANLANFIYFVKSGILCKGENITADFFYILHLYVRVKEIYVYFCNFLSLCCRVQTFLPSPWRTLIINLREWSMPTTLTSGKTSTQCFMDHWVWQKCPLQLLLTNQNVSWCIVSNQNGDYSYFDQSKHELLYTIQPSVLNSNLTYKLD